MKQLSLIEKAFFLKKVSLFEDLDLDMLVAIADKMNQDIYDKNESVFEINHKAVRMYFIAQGSVNLLDEQDNHITALKSTDFFGDEALFNEKERTYRAVCEAEALLLTLSRTNLITIITECPSIAIALLSHYSLNRQCRCKKNEN
jgi:signal-transduction protein with cAMP-binding, CBS, and nucleotidyltransferase domain